MIGVCIEPCQIGLSDLGWAQSPVVYAHIVYGTFEVVQGLVVVYPLFCRDARMARIERGDRLGDR